MLIFLLLVMQDTTEQKLNYLFFILLSDNMYNNFLRDREEGILLEN